MLHVLLSIKKEASEEAGAPGSSYKKKESKDKANSSSSHNWNTLFMGPNAMANAITQKYNTTKSQVFDHETKGSVAVRVALGETQLVQEVRRFLLDNGVCLDSFSQAAAERSKTVILAQNPPAGTLPAKLQETFGCFGSLGHALLPEGSVTAIVEFLEPLEARKAFRQLAYSTFHHVPLYLKWVPTGIFSSAVPKEKLPQNVPAEPAGKDKVELGADELMEAQGSVGARTLKASLAGLSLAAVAAAYMAAPMWLHTLVESWGCWLEEGHSYMPGLPPEFEVCAKPCQAFLSFNRAFPG